MSEIKDTQVEETTQDNVQDTAPVEKSFSQKDIDAIIEKRLARERKESETRIKEAVTEAQKLAKMSADERMEHERIEREKQLKDREHEITKRELRAEAKAQLADKGLPVELAEVLPYTDAETTSAALEAVEKVFRAAVEKGINDRLKGSAPKVNSNVTQVSEKDKLIAQHNEAEKKGDVLRMLTLEAQIKKLKE